MPASMSLQRLIGYAQNHDQIGNRATGERLSALISPGLQKVAACLVLTSPFTPMLFMGEEWGASTPWQYFTDHEDPRLASAVREGRRNEFRAFGWQPEDVPDPQEPETIQRSKLDWSELERVGHADIFRWYRDLIALRRARPELTDGRLGQTRVDVDGEMRVIVVRRGATVVVVNLSTVQRPVEVDATTVLLASAGTAVERGRILLAPESAAILAAD
jgi:maltooligosyltrehalose trehalohydrolase